MTALDSEQFAELARAGHTRIPVFRSVAADLDTPLSVYLKLVDGPDGFLLESVEGGENWGRYSIIGLPCRRRHEFRGTQRTTREFGRTVEVVDVDDVFAEVDRLRGLWRSPAVEDLPGFSGGLVGYFGYETVAHLEDRLDFSDQPGAIDAPDIVLLEADEVAVFDNLAGRLYLVVNADPAAGDALARTRRRLDQLAHRLRSGSPGYPPPVAMPVLDESDFTFGFQQSDFQAAVECIREYILAGDVMQVVLSQRMSIPLPVRPLDVYRALRSLNPSPYMYFLDFGDFQVVGASPEVLVRVTDGHAMVRPIAGTRPRGATPQADRELEAELLADPKERAEHLMLIDLGRNDIGRIAETGSVELTDRMVVERYSHVMHMVSQVQGRLCAGYGPVQALQATFPAGTLSGAPKVRAMEIIRELEPVRRGLYGGAVGYFNGRDDADFAIAIRTALVADGILHLQAGAGIVADSDPRREWQETLSKGRAVIRAVTAASNGLHRDY